MTITKDSSESMKICKCNKNYAKSCDGETAAYIGKVTDKFKQRDVYEKKIVKR